MLADRIKQEKSRVNYSIGLYFSTNL